MFKPLFKVKSIAKNAQSLVLQDITPVASVDYLDGYGGPGCPANFAAVTSFVPLFMYMGENAWWPPSSVTGTYDTGATLNKELVDGVYTVKLQYEFGGVMYPTTVTILVLNTGSAGLVKDIAAMAVQDCGCDYAKNLELMNRLLLKLAAQTSFANGDLAKAHTAAQLLNNSAVTNIIPCTTCG